MEIWYRRLLIVPTGIVFLLLLLVTLVLQQFQDTLLDPDHLIEEAQEADIYEFVMVDLFTSVVDEVRELDAATFSDELEENPLPLFGLTTDEIVRSANRAVSREWLQGVVEDSIVHLSRYIAGETEQFTVTPNATTQGASAIREVRRLLNQADAYDIMYEEFVDPRVEELVESTDFPQGFDPPPEKVIAALRAVFPPDWTQRQFEIALAEITPYLLGERDEFRIVVPLGDRSTTAMRELKNLLREIDAYDWLANDVVLVAVQDAMEGSSRRTLRVDDERYLEAVGRVVTTDWLRLQVENMIDEAGPYLTGSEETFEIRVPLSDRAELAMDEALLIMVEEDETDYPYRKFVEPRLIETIGESLHLQFGVSVTGREVARAIRANTPDYWFRQHANWLLLDASPYLLGQADYFESRIALSSNKIIARKAIADLVRDRTVALIQSLPRCDSAAEAKEALLSRGSDELPSCIASDVAAEQVLIQIGLDVYDTVERVVLSRIPENAVFDERLLRRFLSRAGHEGTLDLHVVSYFTRDTSATVPDLLLEGTFDPSTHGRTGVLPPDYRAEQNLAALDQTRDLLRNGWIYTDAHLRRDIEKRGPDAQRRLDDIREIMADGWSFTETDLHQLLRRQVGGFSEPGDDSDPVKRLDDLRAFLSEDWSYTHEDFRGYLARNLPSGGLRTFDASRSVFKLIGFSPLVAWIPLVLLLLSIGYLGGRVWSTRIAWAMAVLLISSVLIHLAFSPDYGNFAKSGPLYEAAGVSDLSEFRSKLIDLDAMPDDFHNSYRMAASKLFDMTGPTVDLMAEGVATSSRNLAILALVGLVASILLPPIAASSSSLVKNRLLPRFKKLHRTGTVSESVGTDR